MKDTKIVVKGILQYGDKYLLIKKWYDDRITEPYQWEFVDGHIQIGESPDDALDEIVSEKTFLNIVDKKILYTWSYVVGDTGYIGLAYLCNVSSDLVILSEDLNDYAWVTLDEFEDYIENKSILNDVYRALKK